MIDLKELKYAVQYRYLNGACYMGWHTIAAFDVNIVALQYARDCAVGRENKTEYRVMEINHD